MPRAGEHWDKLSASNRSCCPAPLLSSLLQPLLDWKEIAASLSCVLALSVHAAGGWQLARELTGQMEIVSHRLICVCIIYIAWSPSQAGEGQVQQRRGGRSFG
ncbi:hypothetical protein GUJ93_ZPchr0005g14290 [Zizania palustris]|uniref:Uncharacterized protein n=1 Tax=Zizania palustris TaxID=103762 RepID=A0A8J5VIE3_ZIZPA|nr:hypothetical protein GUJ93_ZPchr0005g14290 [Zizania palustris]